MDPEKEYQKTKEETENLIQNLCMYLGEKKGNDYTYEEMPKYASVDFRLTKNGEKHIYIEVKIRSHEYGHYAEEKVPLSKYCFGYTFKNKFKINSFLLVKWSDGKAGLISLSNPTKIETMTARHDRREAKDIYAFYDHTKFKLLDI
jgi:hypothetical protein